MCGILGFIGNRYQNYVEPAIATLRSRGPDEQAVLNLGEAVLAHTRLAVIDLSGGNQPMQSPDCRYTLVFNGEIYNFPELRLELENQGIVFTTKSDTEVLLHGLIVWGESVLPRLDGMFAFALWDSHKRTLLAARDSIGIKPLMYSTIGGGIIFASTTAPFLAIPDFPHQVNPEALRDYLAFDAPMIPHTILQGVRQLAPAEVLHYDAHTNKIDIKRWWHIPPADLQADDEDALQRVESGIRESVRRQMVADVPLGAFLSGGIDSSLMVRYMAEMSSHRIKTFSMKFATGAFDESAYAQEVSDRFNTEHHILEAPTIDGNDLVTAIGALDQPLADPAYITTYFLARHTRRHVTVAISGDGGDELFGGYLHHLEVEDKYPERWWHNPLGVLIKQGIAPQALVRRSLWGREYLHYCKAKMGPWRNRKQFSPWFDSAFVARLQPEKTIERWLLLLDELGGKMDSGTLMRLDLGVLLADKYLVKTDRASMAHGLEVRVPFLGMPVIPTALSLPPQAHFKKGLKTLLTELARRDLPRCVWDRPKHGFDVPVKTFLTGAWRKIGNEVIADAATIAPFLNKKMLQTRWQQTLQGHHGADMYKFIVLLMWMREHRITG